MVSETLFFIHYNHPKNDHLLWKNNTFHWSSEPLFKPHLFFLLDFERSLSHLQAALTKRCRIISFILLSSTSFTHGMNSHIYNLGRMSIECDNLIWVELVSAEEEPRVWARGKGSDTMKDHLKPQTYREV